MDIKQEIKNLRLVKLREGFKFENLIQKYLLKIIDEYKQNKKIYSVLNIEESQELKNQKGVYLIFAEKNNKILFTYVGESTNISNRWKQHISAIKKNRKKERLYKSINFLIRNFELKIEEINFLIIESGVEDQNKRLALETWNIYKTKTEKHSLNRVICSKRLRCPNNHGLCKTRMKYEIIDNEIQMIITGRCKTKTCKENFQITKEGKIISEKK